VGEQDPANSRKNLIKSEVMNNKKEIFFMQIFLIILSLY